MSSRFLPRLIACVAVCCALSSARAETTAADVEWRQEYNKARQEAVDKGRPLVIDIGTTNCYWCKQLDQRTFRDPAVVKLLNERCIPLKIDAEKHAALAEALRVETYPTLVFASPDGKILGSQAGFIEAPGLQDMIQRTLAAAAAPPDWMARDFQDASKAVSGADFARAVVLLRNILEDGKDRPVQAQARQMLQDLEQQASGRCAKAKQLVEVGKVTEAAEAAAEVVQQFPGTKAARDGVTVLVSLAGRRSEANATQRTQAARDLLTQAREEYAKKHFLACLDRCEGLVTGYADLPEAAEAGKLVAEIKGNPEFTRQACEQMGDRISLLYLTLAENWLKKGQPQQAVFYLERVVLTFPQSRHAELAQVRLTQIQGVPARNAEVKK